MPEQEITKNDMHRPPDEAGNNKKGYDRKFSALRTPHAQNSLHRVERIPIPADWINKMRLGFRSICDVREKFIMDIYGSSHIEPQNRHQISRDLNSDLNAFIRRNHFRANIYRSINQEYRETSSGGDILFEVHASRAIVRMSLMAVRRWSRASH